MECNKEEASRAHKSYTTSDKKLAGWASSSTAIKKESYDQVLETGEAKKMRSYEDVISEHNRRMEEIQKKFDEGTRRWLSSLTAVKKESQDQESAFQPLVKMNYFPLPPTAVKRECLQDLEPVKKSIFEVYGFNNTNERRRRREEELQKRVEEEINKVGSVAKRQRHVEKFEEKLGGFRASSSIAGRKESHEQESENGATVKMLSRRQMLEKSMKNVHVEPNHSDTTVWELATFWKGKIRTETPRSSSLDVLAFLHFIVAHKLHNSAVINKEEITKLASSIAHHKEAPKLFQSLGLDDNMVPVFVEELINTRQYIPAVRLICFFKLIGFSPLILLNKEIESQLAQEKDGRKSRDILELLADYKLEIDIPRELIVKLMCHQPDTQNQVQPLMDQVKNKKVELEATTNELRSTTVKLDEQKEKLKSLERKTERLKAELCYMRDEELTVRESIEDGKIELKKIQEDTNDARRNAACFERKIRKEIDVMMEANKSIYQLTKRF